MKGVGFLFFCVCVCVSGEIFHYGCFTKVNFFFFVCLFASFVFGSFFFPSQFRIYFKANRALGEEEEKSDYKINHHQQQ